SVAGKSELDSRCVEILVSAPAAWIQSAPDVRQQTASNRWRRTHAMTESARRWRVLSAGVAAGLAGFVSLAGNTASAERVLPMPPAPVLSPLVQQAAPLAPAAAP